MLMSNPVPNPTPLDGVVRSDGSVVVSPEQVAGLGLQPGMHLQLVPVGRSLSEIMEAVQRYQREHGVAPASEEEVMTEAVKAVREVRTNLGRTL
jgi:hypothetical protein